MDEILKQAPDGINKEIINEIYIKNNNDITKTLMELWHITDNKKPKEFSKWDEIRETCDAYDTEMTKMLKEAKNKNKISN
jgi:hypothetical protein